MHKFLLIFHTLVQTFNSDEPQEETEGFVADTILQIVSIIAGILKNNIDSLNIPTVLKIPLKNYKSCLFHKQKAQRRVIQVIQNQKKPRTQVRPRRPARPAGRGEKNNDRIRVRNRRYKIKRFLLQPRNINLTHNGRIVRRMLVRRRIIYPSARRRRQY